MTMSNTITITALAKSSNLGTGYTTSSSNGYPTPEIGFYVDGFESVNQLEDFASKVQEATGLIGEMAQIFWKDGWATRVYQGSIFQAYDLAEGKMTAQSNLDWLEEEITNYDSSDDDDADEIERLNNQIAEAKKAIAACNAGYEVYYNSNDGSYYEIKTGDSMRDYNDTKHYEIVLHFMNDDFETENN